MVNWTRENFDALDEVKKAFDSLILASPNHNDSEQPQSQIFIPLTCRPIDHLPAELRGIQYQPYDLDALTDRLRDLIEGRR